MRLLHYGTQNRILGSGEQDWFGRPRFGVGRFSGEHGRCDNPGDLRCMPGPYRQKGDKKPIGTFAKKRRCFSLGKDALRMNSSTHLAIASLRRVSLLGVTSDPLRGAAI